MVARPDQGTLRARAYTSWHHLATLHPSKLPKKVQARLREAYVAALSGPSLSSYVGPVSEAVWESFDRYNQSWVAHPILEACFGRIWE